MADDRMTVCQRCGEQRAEVDADRVCRPCRKAQAEIELSGAGDALREGDNSPMTQERFTEAVEEAADRARTFRRQH